VARLPQHQAFLDRYESVFEKGWDATRADRLARQKALGLVPADTVLPERNPGERAATGPQDRTL
jgi:arylsulfatase